MSTVTAPDTLVGAPRATAHRGRLATLVRGREADAPWVRPSLWALLLLTGLLYIWHLSASGWANSFYAAAVQAGTQSWKAFFFGSFDASNYITVDKPPASLWVMEISARIFGLSSWSLLVPQALEGVAAVGILYLAVRRVATPAAGLIAGAVLALTPVAALMFRYDNPDSLLVLLMVGAAYATTRAVQDGRTRWLVLAGALLGFGFLTKQLQVFLVLPGFALAYLLAGPPGIGKRIWQLLLGGAALVVAAGWWIAIVSLVPAADRPYIGGSTDNSILELTLGYNGIGRLTGNETGSVIPGAAGQGTGTGAGMWGATGITRLFGSEMGTQASWLIPAALIGLLAGLLLRGRRPRTDGPRAALITWGGWLLVTGLTFSFAQGIIHPYYTVALAPAIGALVGLGASALWRFRRLLLARIGLALMLLVTAGWAWHLLGTAPTFLPWLRWLVLIGSIAVAVVTVVGARVRRLAVVAALAALVLGVAAPAAYAVQTATTAHTGPLPSAGPAGQGGFGGPGGNRGAGGRPPGAAGGTAGGPGGFGQNSTGTGGQNGTGTQNGTGSQQFGPPGATGSTTGPGATGGTATTRGFAGGQAGGGFGGAQSISSALTTLLLKDADSYTWVAATSTATNGASYQLATGRPVMAIGGFNGTDQAQTLTQFKARVAAGQIHYFIGTGSGFGGGQSGGDVSAIASWVAANFTAQSVGGTTVYDLTSPSSTG